MPQKIERQIGLTEDQKEHLITGNDWTTLTGKEVFTTPEDEKRAWKRNRTKLMAICASQFGLFVRPRGWWLYDASEPRNSDMETGAVYLERHPELLTQAEREHLRTHGLTKWQRMPVSEMAPIEDYIRSKNFRDLLSADELEALNEHLALTGVKPFTIQ